MEILLPHFGLLFWTLISFLITLFLLSKFAWKPITKAIKKREGKIEEAISNTKDLEQKIEKLKQDNEDMLSKVRQEKSAILDEAQKQANDIITASKEEAKSVQNKMIALAQEDIETMKMKAFKELKSEVAQMVIDTTEKILQEKLKDKEKDQDYILNAIKEYETNA